MSNVSIRIDDEFLTDYRYRPGGYDPLDRVGRAEPSNCEDGSSAVYTPSLVQSPLLPPKGGADKALYSPKVFGVVVRR